VNKEEERLQVQLVAWFKFQYPSYKDLISIPSFGENVGPRRMRRLKQMGLTPGWPDLFFAIPSYNPKFPNGMFIELKSRGKKPTRLQSNNHKILRSAGYFVFVADNFEYAMSCVQNYMKNAKKPPTFD